MAAALQDTRLRDKFSDALARAEQLDVTDNHALIRDAAVADGRAAVDTFATIIEREDVQEVARIEAESSVAETRQTADHAFTAIRSSLGTGLALMRANNETGVIRETREAEGYLDRVQASDFKSMSHADARTNLERAVTYVDKLVPDELGAPVMAVAQPALDNFTQAVEGQARAEGKWVEAQASLEAGRAQVRDAYLSFRDHMRGILRQTGQIDKLGQIVPALHDIIRAGHGTPTNDDPTVDPAGGDEPTPEPIVDEA
ncbi:hypothetical protein FIV42_19060 [Persicimonas caeni]|uniref:Uncharacterized protein n=1 Tax=Persicimonas caeni TaxID=2292766 RepID=A0A4Y6PYE6_PERCE|nr:hypothetical protein [Persicimonas caeni]QDG52765.1 hypothetical protein FIV42_19060 [Persicimonas caeni]QED33987.1 hypothetical protein FRD00_19055 [Persicimonas caeni]